MEITGLSQVPGRPPCSVCTCSSTPARRLVPDHFQNHRMAPAKGTTKALANRSFRSSITWLSDSLRAPSAAWSASSRSLPHATQDSLPVVGQTLPDGIHTRRVTIKGFRFNSFHHPPLPSFLAQTPLIGPVCYSRSFTKHVAWLFTLVGSMPSGPRDSAGE